MKALLIFGIISISYATIINSTDYKIKIEKIYESNDIIWGIEELSPTQILFTERDGSLGLYDLITKKYQKISHALNIAETGQGGLLDIKKSPNFKKDKLIYLTYSTRNKTGYTTELARGKLDSNTLSNITILFTAIPSYSQRHHFGSRIVIDPPSIYLSVGDRGNRDLAQNLDSHNGKIIKINMDGSTPTDNPFVGQKEKLSEIWSYGHRNPQGLFMSDDKSLWAIEHGPRGGDEINLIKKGKNYGWPIISYGKEYALPIAVGEGTYRKGMEQPHLYYVPSIAPSSLIVYSGKHFKKWKNQLFAGALKLEHINRVTINGDKGKEEERLFKSLEQRIRSLTEDSKGRLLFGTDDGIIFRASIAQ